MNASTTALLTCVIASCAAPQVAPAQVFQPGGIEAKVYRTRGELPPWLAPHVPADFDFRQYMLAARDPAHGIPSPVQILPAPEPVIESGDALSLDFRYPPLACRPCRGAHDPELPVIAAVEPTRVWRLPNKDRRVFIREQVTSCPPCYAP